MISPRYTDLITVDELSDMSLESLPESLKLAIADSDTIAVAKKQALNDGLARIITYWTARIEAYLGRKLIVRPATAFPIEPDYWRQRPELSTPGVNWVYGARAPQYPVLQIESVDGDITDDMISIAGFEGEFLAFDRYQRTLTPSNVAFFWGYRRPDQGTPSSGGSGSGGGSGAGSGDTIYSTWDDALGTGTDELAGLDTSVFIPELPLDISLCAQRLIVAEIRAQSRGLVGILESEHRADKLTSRTSRIDHALVENELALIYSHKIGF